MAADPHDRWLFMLTIASVPLGCTGEVPAEPTPGGSDTTASPATTTVTTGDAEGSASVVTLTGLDDTAGSRGAETTADDASATGTAGEEGEEGSTTSIEPDADASEGGSTTDGAALCEQWGQSAAVCYGVDDPAYFTSYCYQYLMGLDPMCAAPAQQYYACRATGCFVDCSAEQGALQECNDAALAMQLGCDTISMVPGTGAIEMQCSELVAQATVCTNAGYDIPGLSAYIMNLPRYADYFCNHGCYFTYFFPPPPVGNPCGGAYEDLLSCLSGLECGELVEAMSTSAHCSAEIDAVTCRCELGA